MSIGLHSLINKIIEEGKLVIEKEDWVDSRYFNSQPRMFVLISIVRTFFVLFIFLELSNILNAGYHILITYGKSEVLIADLWKWRCRSITPIGDALTRAILPQLVIGIFALLIIPLSYVWSKWLKIPSKGINIIFKASNPSVFEKSKALSFNIAQLLIFFYCTQYIVSVVYPVLETQFHLITLAKSCGDSYLIVPISHFVFSLGLAFILNSGVYIWRSGDYRLMTLADEKIKTIIYPSKITLQVRNLLLLGIFMAYSIGTNWLPESMKTESHILYHRIYSVSLPLFIFAVYKYTTIAVSKMSFYYIPLFKKMFLPSDYFEDTLIIRLSEIVKKNTNELFNKSEYKSKSIAEFRNLAIETIEKQLSFFLNPKNIIQSFVIFLVFPLIVATVGFSSDRDSILTTLVKIGYIDSVLFLPFIFYHFKRIRTLNLIMNAIQNHYFGRNSNDDVEKKIVLT